ncbi:hypothetical protein SAMD00020551_3207 [Mesobacillus selenatarsenatis SF-1]|uniref:Uncharacterized protein n=1 Tax=Mesobacillus selenatarsenatis (strain DSM 18680 / JCM 14380 / FERM P-15431 / SF-1) TaxID=1321606 RepID=A0A0A8XA62_MESS1|nr:hypothetical protein SAMD00020551_3207 [Mesobacillus selenatarsenatis SF-1]
MSGIGEFFLGLETEGNSFSRGEKNAEPYYNMKLYFNNQHV